MCRTEELHFDGIARAGVYADALQRMILAFKHDHSELASVLAPLAEAALQGSRFHDEIELFVPVPLHWTRRVLRGYNQSASDCRAAAPSAGQDQHRPRPRAPDQDPAAGCHTGRAGRGMSPARSSSAMGTNSPARTVCLVDDIKTSGATLNECAKALKEAGAARVYALVLAVAGQRTG